MPTHLFSPLKIREAHFRNRIFVSPMCQYSAREGLAQTWHLVHLGSRAVGGAGLVSTEATAVCPEGRISPGDTGLWNDAQLHAWAPIAAFIREQGAVPAIQLAHAGRKASTGIPWLGGQPLDSGQGGWTVSAPSPLPFDTGYPVPHELDPGEIQEIVHAFAEAARRALKAGFEAVELHFAHGYLAHEFLSPLSNHRKDDYGGSLENRMRFPLEVADSVRAVWPASHPLLVRLSVTDWVPGGWDLPSSITLSRELKRVGVDLIDCSSGGNVPRAEIPLGPGYQTVFAEAIRRETGVLTGAVGLITEPVQAEHLLGTGQADVVFLARAELRDPYWPLAAARHLGVEIDWPPPYRRGK